MIASTIKMVSIDNKTLTTDLDRAGYRKMGVIVKPAANFEEAMKLMQDEKIDLMVINMDYTPIDAVQICKHIKSLSKYRDIPIILTSVQTANKIRNSALEAGADLFVEQPLPRQYFIEKLKQLLEHKTRTTERVDFHGDVTFTFNDKTETSPIADLSVSGMLVSTAANLESGMAVTLEFELPGYKKALKVEGEVVRSIAFSQKNPDRPTGVGIRFVTFHGDAKKRIEKYVEKSANKDTQMQYYL